MDDGGGAGAAGLGLGAPPGERVAARGGVALEVDGDDRVPLVLGHVEQGPVPEDARVVYEDVESAERFDREGDEVAGGGPVGDVVTAGHGPAAAGPDLGADGFGRPAIGAVAVNGRAEVVDDDARPAGRQGERVGPADAAAGARHNRHAPGEAAHARTPSRAIGRVSRRSADRRP